MENPELPDFFKSVLRVETWKNIEYRRTENAKPQIFNIQAVGPFFLFYTEPHIIHFAMLSSNYTPMRAQKSRNYELCLRSNMIRDLTPSIVFKDQIANNKFLQVFMESSAEIVHFASECPLEELAQLSARMNAIIPGDSEPKRVNVFLQFILGRPELQIHGLDNKTATMLHALAINQQTYVGPSLDLFPQFGSADKLPFIFLAFDSKKQAQEPVVIQCNSLQDMMRWVLSLFCLSVRPLKKRKITPVIKQPSIQIEIESVNPNKEQSAKAAESASEPSKPKSETQPISTDNAQPIAKPEQAQAKTVVAQETEKAAQPEQIEIEAVKPSANPTVTPKVEKVPQESIKPHQKEVKLVKTVPQPEPVQLDPVLVKASERGPPIAKRVAELKKSLDAEHKPEVYKLPSFDELVQQYRNHAVAFDDHNLKQRLQIIMDSIPKEQASAPFPEQFIPIPTESLIKTTLSSLSSDVTVDISTIYDFSAYPAVAEALKSAPQEPACPYLSEITRVIVNIQSSGSTSHDNDPSTLRLSFLVAALFLNGLTGFTSLASSSSLLPAIRELSIVVSDLSSLITCLESEQTISAQASVLSQILLKANLLCPVLREILKNDNWISMFYSKTAQLSAPGLVENLLIILQPLMLTHAFVFRARSDIVQIAPAEDVNRFILTPALSFLEIRSIFESDNQNDVARRVAKEMEVGMRKKAGFLGFSSSSDPWGFVVDATTNGEGNGNDWKELCEVAQNMNVVSLSDISRSQSRIEIWAVEGLKRRKLHAWLCLLFAQTKVVEKWFFQESFLSDPYRAKSAISIIYQKEQSLR